MAALAIVDGVAGIASVRIGSGLDRMKETEISRVHPSLDGIAPAVAIETKHRIGVALDALLGILLGIDLVLV